MKLTRIRIKDFRSFYGEHEFALGSGVNYIVGPNNCGKSNLARALAFALDPHSVYLPERDRPTRDGAAGQPPKTRITLSFEVGNSVPEQTLLKRATAYEVAVREKAGRPTTNPKTQTFAASGEVHLVRTFSGEGLGATTFGAKQTGVISLAANDKIHIDLESQFEKVMRFGVIHSGEDLESLLKGKFSEILQLVINDHLAMERAKAEEARRVYQRALQEELLKPLRDEIEKRVGSMFPEISVADLVPDIPSIDDTLSSVDVRLGDAQSTTQLTEKGTGVRGAVLVSMLQYMADQSRRSMVLAVEEPEAFLHPAAQEAIRGHLEELARRADVSLVVTTHSPYVISRSTDTSVSELRKRADGGTALVATVTGDEPRSGVLGSLYRDPEMAQALESSLRIPEGTEAIVVTEGFTDELFIRECLVAAGQEHRLEGLYFVAANKAKNVPAQALMLKGASSLPIVALLDHDDEGDEAVQRLAGFGWKDRQMILSLKDWPCGCHGKHAAEIEHLIPRNVIDRTVQAFGDDAYDVSFRCGQVKRYELSQAWKKWAITNLSDHLGSSCPEMVWLVEQIWAKAGKQRAKAERDAARAM